MIKSEQQPQEERLSIPELIDGVADQLIDYSLQIKAGDELLIKMDPSGYKIAEAVIKKLEKRFYLDKEDENDPESKNKLKVKVRIQFVQAELEKVLLEGVSKDTYTTSQRESLKIPKNLEQPEDFPDIVPTIIPENRKEDAANVGKEIKSFSLPRAARLDAKVRETMLGGNLANQQEAYLNHGPASDEAKFLATATKVLVIRNNISFVDDYRVEDTVKKSFNSANASLLQVRLNERDWCLIYVPNEQEAKAAGMSLEDYERLCLEACNRPWAEVEKSQQVIVDRLRTAKKARITAPAPADRDPALWTTNVTMDIEGMIAANSVARRNMPGSEVFLAPNAGTLEGQYALPYPVTLVGKVLPDLVLFFEKGKVVRFDTTGNDEIKAHIQKVLDTDEGSSLVGEWGIGTNPSVDEPVLNRLLNEKIKGVHLALGDAYATTNYLGAEIKVDNGVRSSIHEDLARVMTKKYGGGQIILDDTDVIFDDGRFTLPGTEVLNEK